MAQVFTSYSRRDTATVDVIAGRMTEAGIAVWIDREAIKAGNSWRVQIVQAIDTCAAFVLMLSPSSVASDNVRKEIDLAQDSGRTIFAVMLEPIKLPAEIRYQLAGLQFIDVQMLGFENAVRQLITTLQEHLAKLKPAEEPKTHRAELVIQGIDLKAFTADKQQQLLDFLANLTSADRSQLQIVNLAAGSVHVFVNIPSEAAFELKTLALNRDNRLKRFGITALRLLGDRKFINVSLGILTVSAAIGVWQMFWLSIPSLLLPVLGVTGGKILTALLGVALIGALGFSVAIAVPPLLSPSPTFTQMPAPTPTATRTLRPTATVTLRGTSTPTRSLTATATPTLTPTYTPTINATPNAFIQYVKGQTGDLLSCSNIEFAFDVTDPEGVQAVVVQFFVGGKQPNYLQLDAQLGLSNQGGNRWGGFFNDTVSREGEVTHWQVVVFDENGNTTVLHEEGKFSYFAAAHCVPE